MWPARPSFTSGGGLHQLTTIAYGWGRAPLSAHPSSINATESKTHEWCNKHTSIGANKGTNNPPPSSIPSSHTNTLWKRNLRKALFLGPWWTICWPVTMLDDSSMLREAILYQNRWFFTPMCKKLCCGFFWFWRPFHNIKLTQNIFSRVILSQF